MKNLGIIKNETDKERKKEKRGGGTKKKPRNQEHPRPMSVV